MADNIIKLQDVRDRLQASEHMRRWLPVCEYFSSFLSFCGWKTSPELPTDSRGIDELGRLFKNFVTLFEELDALKIRCVSQYGTAEEKAVMAQWVLDNPDRQKPRRRYIQRGEMKETC